MGNFYLEVIKKDQRFSSSARVADLELLEPITRRAVAAIVAGAQAQGHNLMVFETYRSQVRQAQLFRQGLTQLREVGAHHYGLGADLVKLIKGQPSWDGDFSFLGPLARKYGLIWGGDWGEPEKPHSFRDWGHVQRCAVRDQNLLFLGLWYPGEGYDPYAGAAAGTASQPRLSREMVRRIQDLLGTYYTGKIDGIYGPKTRVAVLNFQRQAGLTADGEAGPLTLTALGIK